MPANSADLNEPASPNKIADVLRNAAQKMYEDARELEAAWQDSEAGRVWHRIARELDRTANRVEQICNQSGFTKRVGVLRRTA